MTQMCTFTSRDAKGKHAYSCGLVAQEGSDFCPRHTFLHNIRKQDEDRKERERAAARAASHGTPKTRAELLTGGFQYIGNRDCYGCHKPIEMWRNPQGNRLPYNPMPDADSHAQTHFATCTRAADFRRAS